MIQILAISPSPTSCCLQVLKTNRSDTFGAEREAKVLPGKWKKKEKRERLNYIDTMPPSWPPSDGKHLHFKRFSFLPPPPRLTPCLSRSLTLLDWTFLLQKQFSIIICKATPQCRMQMLLALAAPAWQLLTEHRCGRPLR